MQIHNALFPDRVHIALALHLIVWQGSENTQKYEGTILIEERNYYTLFDFKMRDPLGMEKKNCVNVYQKKEETFWRGKKWECLQEMYM